MKIPPRETDAFIKTKPSWAKAVVIYGPDSGLVKERAVTIGRHIVSDLNDPFNAVTLNGDILAQDPARLSDEANAISMMGGDRLIRIENGDDKITTLLKEYLSLPSNDSWIIIEAGELSPRSTLRKLGESAENCAIIACYAEDERDTARLIRESLGAASLTIDSDALTELSQILAGDRGRTRSEIEKLIIYKGREQSSITLDEVKILCGSAGSASLDALIYAVASGKSEEALMHFGKLIDEGIAFISIIRTLQSHFKRLHEVKIQCESDDNIEFVIKKLSPPVFFKYEKAFMGQVIRWRTTSLLSILQRLMTLESNCKKTGSMPETLCAQTILSLSKMRG